MGLHGSRDSCTHIYATFKVHSALFGQCVFRSQFVRALLLPEFLKPLFFHLSFLFGGCISLRQPNTDNSTILRRSRKLVNLSSQKLPAHELLFILKEIGPWLLQIFDVLKSFFSYGKHDSLIMTPLLLFILNRNLSINLTYFLRYKIGHRTLSHIQWTLGSKSNFLLFVEV